ncbi:MAG: PorV/PorQ family protein [candidate division Zixibacteria bacterium]|nr:PorV/PorQ family protein [candidate division Zixibacteria bacterium]
MRKLMLIQVTLIASCLVLFTAVTSLGQDINSGAGTSGFSFLKINVGGRAVAMGGAYTGLADDEAALYYNPAGIATIEDPRFIAEYHNYFVGLQSGFAGYIKPLGLDRTVAIHITYLNYGEFTQTDQSGNIEGTFGGGDIMLAGTYAMRRSQQFMLGVTAKLIYESIQDYSAAALAFDLGLRYTSNRGRHAVGLQLQNLGAQLSSLGESEKDGLPTVFRLGASSRPRGLNSVVVADIILPMDNDVQLAVGAEYFEFKPLYLRMGWNSIGSNLRSEYSDNGLTGLTFGMGLDYKSMQFSYAYSPAADLGDSHRVTITGSI